MISYSRILLFIILASLSSNLVYADGGGPLLLIINFMYFLYGSVWILLSEWIVYRYKGNIPWKTAFWDVLIVNALSTIVIGLGFPFLIALLSGAFGFTGGRESTDIGGLFLAIGTWIVGDNSPYPKVAITMTCVWLVVTFVLTVYFETWLLSKRWAKRGFVAPIKPLVLNWYANCLSYVGLLILLIIGLLGKK